MASTLEINRIWTRGDTIVAMGCDIDGFPLWHRQSELLKPIWLSKKVELYMRHPIEGEIEVFLNRDNPLGEWQTPFDVPGAPALFRLHRTRIPLSYDFLTAERVEQTF